MSLFPDQKVWRVPVPAFPERIPKMFPPRAPAVIMIISYAVAAGVKTKKMEKEELPMGNVLSGRVRNCDDARVNTTALDAALYVRPLTGVPLRRFPLLSFHCVTLLPDRTTLSRSAASNQSRRPGRVSGLNRGVCEDVPTIDIFAYKSRIVLHTSRETTSVCVLLLGMMSGLVKFNVLVSVMVSWDEVELRRDQ